MDEIESWEELLDVFEQFEWTQSHAVEGGTIYAPSAQLEDSLGKSDWYSSDWYFEESPEGVELYTLLGMLWDSSGAPISWDGRLEMVQVGDEAAYVFLWLEGFTDTPELLGKVVPPQTSAAYRTLLLELMRSSETYLSVPDHLSNGRPDLLDQATIRQGFWELLQRAEGENRPGWSDLWEKVERPIRGLFNSSMAEAEEEEAPPLPDADHQALLDRYFEKHYEEDGDE